MTTDLNPEMLAKPDAEGLGDVLRDYLDVARRLQQTHETLQHEVVRLRGELDSKDRELERRRRLAALGELAAGVAHEVRNPLGAIQLYSDLLRNECSAHDLQPALGLLEKIDAGIRAIDSVVQDTLSLAPRGRQLAAHPLNEIIVRAADVLLGHLRAKDVTLDVICPDPTPCVLADAAGLQRVLVNLIANATDASPRGGVVRLTVVREADEGVRVAVTDDGPGLPDELIDRVFDPFVTTKEHGTGLGLTIAHRLIETYGGQLTAGNRPTGGAEFRIHLRDGRGQPAAGQEPPARRSSAA